MKKESSNVMQALYNLLAEKFRLTFDDTELLETAFTHTSYANEHRLLKISHNERLEFLGDAVLQLVISEYLFALYPSKPEGDLSKMRSMIVREESLAGFSRDCGFDQFIKLGKGEEKSGGRNRDTILGDLFEAFLGALLLDKGVEMVRNFIQQVMIQIHGDVLITYEVTSESGPAHAKEFEVQVSVNGKIIGQGRGRSKKAAEQEAAKKAVENKVDPSCI